MNFIGDHPLNLIGKVAIVTSASSAQGAAICRYLLNSNAFVLGVDSSKAHDSTQSSKSSHFQFLVSDNSSDLGERIIEEVTRHYQKEIIDFVINVVEEDDDGVEKLAKIQKVFNLMAKSGNGLVLSVCEAERGDEGEIISTAKLAASKANVTGVKWNVILPYNILSDSNHRFILDCAEKDALQRHIKEHDAKREGGGYSRECEREVANIALFFCTSEGSQVNGALVGIDGTCVSL